MQDILTRICRGENLPLAEMAQVVDTIMRGKCRDEEIAALLLAPARERGKPSRKLPAQHRPCVDT